MTSPNRKRVGYIGIAIGTAAIAGVAITAGAATPPARPARTTDHASTQGPHVRTTPRISTVQRRTFGIFRQASSASEPLPSGAAGQLANTLAVKNYGANVKLARNAGVQSGAAWVAPGNGHTCLIANTDRVPDGADTLPSGLASCAPDGQAANGDLIMSFTAQKPHQQFVAGLLPDGIRAVSANLTDGSTITVPVTNNVYTVRPDGSTSVASVRFANADGTIVTVKP